MAPKTVNEKSFELLFSVVGRPLPSGREKSDALFLQDALLPDLKNGRAQN
jgi:hypothetical protein